MSNSRKAIRGNIVWNLHCVHNMTYREIAKVLGVSTARAWQLVRQYEANVLRGQSKRACELFGINTHIESLGGKFMAEAVALCESLNGAVELKGKR